MLRLDGRRVRGAFVRMVPHRPVGTSVQATYAGSPRDNAWVMIFGYTTNELATSETITIVSNGALFGTGDTLALLETEGSTLTGSTTL